MEPLTINLLSPDEVSLPAEIINTGLSLSEIGALFYTVAILRGLAAPNDDLMESAEMKAALKKIGSLNIVSAEVADGKLKVRIDLEKLINPGPSK